jgi:membrane protein
MESSTPTPSKRPRLEWPWDLSLREWRSVVRDVVQRIQQDHVNLTAAALAFYGLLAVFPTLISVVSITRLSATPESIERGVAVVSQWIPESGREVLHQELKVLLSHKTTGASLGLVVSVLTALWGASSGVHSLLLAVDLAYDGKDTKSIIRRRAQSIAVTLGLVVFLAIVLALTAVVPGIARTVSAQFPGLATLALLRWPLMFALYVGFLTLLYRYAAGKDRPMRWNASGALVGTLGWLITSAAFSFYVSTLASYDRTYGALGGVVVLVFWVYLSSFAILVGAEVNGRIERLCEEKRASQRPQSSSAVAEAGSLETDLSG